MRSALPGAILLMAALCVGAGAAAQPEARLVPKVKPLPMAIDPAFQFRKTKLFHLTEQDPLARQSGAGNDSTSQGNGRTKPKSTSAVQDASITFERQSRFYGAVTGLDQRQRFGDYFDFFWREKRPAAVTVRLEYQQEKLHAHVQAQEVNYGTIQGSRKTSFKVVGDDYLDSGRVIAWRCVLIENGVIVAENLSYLWR